MDACEAVEKELQRVITKFSGVHEHAKRMLGDVTKNFEDLRSSIAEGKSMFYTYVNVKIQMRLHAFQKEIYLSRLLAPFNLLLRFYGHFFTCIHQHVCRISVVHFGVFISHFGFSTFKSSMCVVCLCFHVIFNTLMRFSLTHFFFCQSAFRPFVWFYALSMLFNCAI